MAYSIGLLDYDSLYMKKYEFPNYDLGVIYNYLKQDQNNSVRLIISAQAKNLGSYDKIYVFKTSKILPHPSVIIKDYYKYPVEEYGEGFIQRPLRPFFTETRFTRPDFKCYNPIIQFSCEHTRHPLAWKIGRRAKQSKYYPIRLFEDWEGESLKKDVPIGKRILVYDNPTDIFSNEKKMEYYEKLVQQKHLMYFSQPLDISLIKDTNLIERLLGTKRYIIGRPQWMVSDINVWVLNLLEKYLRKEITRELRLSVYISPDTPLHQQFITMVRLGYFSLRTKGVLRFSCFGNKNSIKQSPLLKITYKYLRSSCYNTSFYEFLINKDLCKRGALIREIQWDESIITRLLKKYGWEKWLPYLETIIETNPDIADMLFYGGSGRYENMRAELFGLNTSKQGFTVLSKTKEE